jgi:uncharacterized protein YsxB (DUF464 family)
MIRIKFSSYGLTVDGHSDKTLADHEKVCTAVGSVVLGYAAGLEALSDKPVKTDTGTEHGGHMSIDWGNAPSAEAWILIEGLRVALGWLASSYPAHITLDD